MDSQKWILPAFALMALVQLYVPASMILNREDVISAGTEFRFKTAPVDPSDPFRGKYITLRYEADWVKVSDQEEWIEGETIYVSLTTDEEGYAMIMSASHEKPTDTHDFLQVKVAYFALDGSRELRIEYPFDRYYMEESKAYDAEQLHRSSQINPDNLTYALVNVKDGEAVLKDVLIDGVSIKEMVKMARQEQ